MRKLIEVMAVALLLIAPLYAGDGGGKPDKQLPPGKSGNPVYVIVLNRGKGTEPDLAKHNAQQLAKWSDKIVVQLPEQAVEALRKHPRVKFVQLLVEAGSQKHDVPAPRTSMSSAATMAPTSVTNPAFWTTGTYEYDGAGNVKKVGPGVDGYTRRYVYDPLSRLTTAGMEPPNASAGQFASVENYTYDAFGNRLSRTSNTSSTIVGVDPLTNRVLSSDTMPVVYDAVGNQKQWGNDNYTYDPFNLTKEHMSGYHQKMAIYTADDERIAMCGDGTIGPCQWTIRNLDGKVLRQYESSAIGNFNHPYYWLWNEDYVYRGAQMLGAQRELEEGGRFIYHLDHLGTPRVITNNAGQQIMEDEYEPFGRERTSITQAYDLGYDRPETLRFTGHERDFQDGAGYANHNYTDYMHARSYQPSLGRFFSVDRHLGQPARPQSWNRYAYTSNNPMHAIDPNGLDTFIVIYGSGAVSPNARGLDHDQGRQFEIAANTRASEIRNSGRLADGDALFVMSATNIDEFVAITNRDYASGKIADLEVFSHSWADPAPGGLNLGGFGDRGVRPGSLSRIDRGNFTQGAGITLWGCNAGRTPQDAQKSFAQIMADTLRVPVRAHTGPAEFNDEGRGHPPMLPANPRRYKMETFTPAFPCDPNRDSSCR